MKEIKLDYLLNTKKRHRFKKQRAKPILMKKIKLDYLLNTKKRHRFRKQRAKPKPAVQVHLHPSVKSYIDNLINVKKINPIMMNLEMNGTHVISKQNIQPVDIPYVPEDYRILFRSIAQHLVFCHDTNQFSEDSFSLSEDKELKVYRVSRSHYSHQSDKEKGIANDYLSFARLIRAVFDLSPSSNSIPIPSDMADYLDFLSNSSKKIRCGIDKHVAVLSDRERVNFFVHFHQQNCGAIGGSIDKVLNDKKFKTWAQWRTKVIPQYGALYSCLYYNPGQSNRRKKKSANRGRKWKRAGQNHPGNTAASTPAIHQPGNMAATAAMTGRKQKRAGQNHPGNMAATAAVTGRKWNTAASTPAIHQPGNMAATAAVTGRKRKRTGKNQPGSTGQNQLGNTAATGKRKLVYAPNNKSFVRFMRNAATHLRDSPYKLAAGDKFAAAMILYVFWDEVIQLQTELDGVPVADYEGTLLDFLLKG